MSSIGPFSSFDTMKGRPLGWFGIQSAQNAERGRAVAVGKDRQPILWNDHV